jgi:hypothetical protein
MKGNNFFWISFADLMTSLFFLLLVLFGISIYQYRVTFKELEALKDIRKATQELPKSYFQYDVKYKRYKLNREIQFDELSDVINASDTTFLKSVGKSVESKIDELNSNPKYKKRKIVYLIIIEGMSSRIRYDENFELSYKRAFSVYKLWKRTLSNQSILFRPEICEIQISGSGEDGIREFSGVNEEKNQQILIHIIPKYDFENKK